MQQYIILCRSLTYAQRAVSVLERSGITTSLSRAPQMLTDRGCGYCVKVAEGRFRTAVRILDHAGLPHGRMYHQSGTDTYTEVFA